MGCQFILDLPTDIVLSTLQWFDFKSLCAVDSAFSNKDERLSFLCILQCREFVYDNGSQWHYLQIMDRNRSFVNWISNRNIKLAVLNFTRTRGHLFRFVNQSLNVESRQAPDILANVRELRFMSISFSKQVTILRYGKQMISLINACKRLKILKIENCVVDYNIVNCLSPEVLRGLKELCLCGVYELLDNQSMNTLSSCRSLTALTLASSFLVNDDYQFDGVEMIVRNNPQLAFIFLAVSLDDNEKALDAISKFCLNINHVVILTEKETFMPAKCIYNCLCRHPDMYLELVRFFSFVAMYGSNAVKFGTRQSFTSFEKTIRISHGGKHDCMFQTIMDELKSRIKVPFILVK